MSTTLFDIQDAWKIYHVGDVEIPAVRGVTLTIPRGQLVAVSGASGSGKSTFLHLIGCLDHLTRGSFHFDGQPVAGLSSAERARLRNRHIGFVFQSFNLLNRTTVLDNVALPLAYQGVGLKQRRQRAEELLVRVGLQDRLRHHPNQLSGGQQQRAAIARALVTRPPVILADEPTGNLDSDTTAEIMALLTELHQRDGLAIVVVTHEPEVTAYAERRIVFRDGQVVSDDCEKMTSAA